MLQETLFDEPLKCIRALVRDTDLDVTQALALQTSTIKALWIGRGGPQACQANPKARLRERMIIWYLSGVRNLKNNILSTDEIEGLASLPAVLGLGDLVAEAAP